MTPDQIHASNADHRAATPPRLPPAVGREDDDERTRVSTGPLNKQAIVSCIGLTKTFRDFWHRNRVRAVDSIDLHIHRGEVFGLLGPNGSGKTTTIKMILGLLNPTAGRIAVFGKRPDDVATKKRIGYLPEESYLYRFLDARETLDYYGRLFGLKRQHRQWRIDTLLEMVGLEAVGSRPVGEYSAGMQRRIGLAQALINDPQLLILDEPTAGLDPIGTRQIKDLIVGLARRGKTILLCSHLLADVEDVCDRVAIMFGGKIRASGPVDELLIHQGMTTIHTSTLDDQTLSQIEKVLEAKGRHIDKVEQPRQKLEALFLKVVQQAQAEGIDTQGARSSRKIADFLVRNHPASALGSDSVDLDPSNLIIKRLMQPPSASKETQPEGVTPAPAPEAPEATPQTPNAEAAPVAASDQTRDPHEPQPSVDISVIEELIPSVDPVPTPSPQQDASLPKSQQTLEPSTGFNSDDERNESHHTHPLDDKPPDIPQPLSEAVVESTPVEEDIQVDHDDDGQYAWAVPQELLSKWKKISGAAGQSLSDTAPADGQHPQEEVDEHGGDEQPPPSPDNVTPDGLTEQEMPEGQPLPDSLEKKQQIPKEPQPSPESEKAPVPDEKKEPQDRPQQDSPQAEHEASEGQEKPYQSFADALATIEPFEPDEGGPSREQPGDGGTSSTDTHKTSGESASDGQAESAKPAPDAKPKSKPKLRLSALEEDSAGSKLDSLAGPSPDEDTPTHL